MKHIRNAWPRNAALWVLIGILAVGTACKEENDDGELENTLLLSSLALALTPQNPGSCSFTFGSRTVPIQELDLAANSSTSFPNGFTILFKSWAALKIPTVANGTTVAFNYAPWYVTGGNTFFLVYNESGCPLTNSSNADFNYTFPDLQSTRTPTNYSVSGNTITFNATGAGKNFVVVSAASSRSGTESVTRTN